MSVIKYQDVLPEGERQHRELDKQLKKDFIREMNSVLHDESCDCSECLGIPSGVMEAPSWCPGCKQLRKEKAELIEVLEDVRDDVFIHENNRRHTLIDKVITKVKGR